MNQSTIIFENIKRICGEKNLPLTEVSKMSETSWYTIYSWRRRENPGVYSLLPVAKALNVSLDELVGWEPEGDDSEARLKEEISEIRQCLFDTTFGEAKKAQQAGEVSRSATDDETIAREFRNLDRHLSTLNAMLKLIATAGQGNEFLKWLDDVPGGEQHKDNIVACKYIKSLIEEMKEDDSEVAEAGGSDNNGL